MLVDILVDYFHEADGFVIHDEEMIALAFRGIRHLPAL